VIERNCGGMIEDSSSVEMIVIGLEMYWGGDSGRGGRRRRMHEIGQNLWYLESADHVKLEGPPLREMRRL